MKHAIIFRNQALACRLGLLPDKFPECHSTSPEHLKLNDRNDAQKVAAKMKIHHKTTFPETKVSLPKIPSEVTAGFFSYRQRPFVEDDVTVLFDGITIVASDAQEEEKMIERKCPFCRMRFMFEVTFEEHYGICIHRRFTQFIHQCNQVHQMKLERCITPHEFIRRMVFLLQTNQDILAKLQMCEEKIQIYRGNCSETPEESSLGITEESGKVPQSILNWEKPEVVQANDLMELMKTAKCSNCEKTFLTISHLDVHKLLHCRMK